MKIIFTAIAVVFSLCVFVWLRHTENFNILFDSNLPAGQRFYLVSKLLALLAIASLVAQLMLMLASRYASVSWLSSWTALSHQWLGLSTFVLIGAHGATFLAAASLRAGSPVFSLLLPNFHTGLYNAAVSLGVVAFYLSILLIILGVLSQRKRSTFGRYHWWILWPLMACVLIHSIAIGSESKTWPMILFYGASVVVIGWLIVRRRQFKKG